MKEKIKYELNNDLLDLLQIANRTKAGQVTHKIAEILSKSIKSHEEYADWKINECLPERNMVILKSVENDAYTAYKNGYQGGFNDCIDQMLLNADIKCKCCGKERCDCGKTHNEQYSGFDAVA